jgi:cell division septation protein DedD
MSTDIQVAVTGNTETTERGTSYVILEERVQRDGPGGTTYEPVETVTATSAVAAIRKAAENAGAGTYVAIPERSFTPTKVTVETKQTVRLG